MEYGPNGHLKWTEWHNGHSVHNVSNVHNGADEHNVHSYSGSVYPMNTIYPMKLSRVQVAQPPGIFLRFAETILATEKY